MARVQVRDDGIDEALDAPTLIEGLPGAGLVGKIAADHVVETFGMARYADVRCDGLPQVAVYRSESSGLEAPVRLHADPDRDLLVLQSDVPVSPSSATGFADCVTSWLDDNGVTPIYLSGLSRDGDGEGRELSGVATGGADALLDEAGIGPPSENGLVSGPTGALLARADERDLDAVGLVVETEAQFPDPEAARALIEDGIEPLTGIEVDTDPLLDHAEEIRRARQRLAQQLQNADDESTQAQPLRMFQ